MKTSCSAIVAASVLAAGILLLTPPCPVLAQEPASHTVQKNDDLHLLAAYYYRDPRHWKVIWEANRGAVPGPSTVPEGIVLVIPGEKLNPFPVAYAEWRGKVYP